MKKIFAGLLGLSLALSVSASSFAKESTKQTSFPKSGLSIAGIDPFEPNNGWYQAFGPLASGTTYTAEVSDDNDGDFYYFHAKPGTVTLTLTNLANTNVDVGIISDTDFELIGKSENSGNTSEYINVKITKEDDYHILVAPGKTGSTYPSPYSFKVFFTN